MVKHFAEGDAVTDGTATTDATTTMAPWATQAATDAAETANKLSDFTPRADITNPYQKTSYIAQDYTPQQVTAQQIAAQQIAVGDASKTEMQRTADATAGAMDSVHNTGTDAVTTDKFTDPGNAEAYMNPYTKNVTDIAVREARNTADIQKNKTDAGAQQAGAFGGERQAITDSEAERGERQLESDIRVKGLDTAYTTGQQQYSTDAGRQLQADTTTASNTMQSVLSNQSADMTKEVQNLSAEQQVILANQATKLAENTASLTAEQQTKLANLQKALDVAKSNQATDLSAKQANQSASLAAATSNQSAGLTANAQNIGNKQFGASLAQTSEAQNAQFGIQSQLANVDKDFRAADTQLKGAQVNQGLAGIGNSTFSTQASLDIANMNNDTAQRAQDLNMSQFQTNTSLKIAEDLAKQYGDIDKWPADALNKAIIAISTGS